MVLGRGRDALAAWRLRPGDGSPMPRLRWWQALSRSVRATTAPGDATSTYTVDVRRGGDLSDGEVRARLYVDGALDAVSRMPARFPVPGGHIVVAARMSGLRRCHYVRADGTAVPLIPHPASAEGRRARLARTRPWLSRAVDAVSTVLVVVGVAVVLLQLAETLSQVPAVTEAFGVLEVPVRLPVAVEVAAGMGAVVASAERALRLRATWIDDLATS